MMPQFARNDTYRFQLDNFLIGSAYFLIGLFKKVVLARHPALCRAGIRRGCRYALTALEAWGGVSPTRFRSISISPVLDMARAVEASLTSICR